MRDNSRRMKKFEQNLSSAHKLVQSTAKLATFNFPELCKT